MNFSKMRKFVDSVKQQALETNLDSSGYRLGYSTPGVLEQREIRSSEPDAVCRALPSLWKPQILIPELKV
jgi:hypothetical protein